MGIFKNIFSRKEPMVPFPLSFLECDLHSHLIPGIDDGAKTIEDSIALAKGFVDLGYKRIVTTPHIMSDYYQNNPTIIKNGLETLQRIFAEEKIDLQVEAAAEYYVDFDFIKKIGKEELLTFGDNNILIECSFIEPPKALKEALFELQTNGYKPILAHPERYPYWHRDIEDYVELKDREILFQINILSLSGHYGIEVAKTAEALIKNNMVELLGTDLHNQIQLNKLTNLHFKESFVETLNKATFLNSALL